MSDKYPSLSPYTYCANNPIKLVDPNGEDFGIPPWLLIKGIARIVEATSNNPDVKTVAYAINHPINAAKTGTANIPNWGISKTASNFEVNVARAAGLTRGEGSQGNAYRHTLWQSMLTVNFGEKQAARIGNVHEESLPSDMSQRIFGDMSQADQMADLLNNAIGREIGSKNRGASNRELAEAVLNEYKENGLWTVSGSDKTGYKVQKTRLTQDQYNAALKEIRTKGKNGLKIDNL